MLSQTHVVIVHGWDSSPSSNWFPWLKEQLSEKGISVTLPEMPNAALPQVEEWIQALHSIVPKTGRVVFVGHSLGCIAIAHYLNQYGKEISCLGCVFVAGFSGNIQNPATANFHQKPLDFQNVISSGGKMTTIFSKDDTKVPFERASQFANQIHAKIMVVDGFGHFVGSQGVTELPIVLDEVLKITFE